jgi:hypothetical protein
MCPSHRRSRASYSSDSSETIARALNAAPTQNSTRSLEDEDRTSFWGYLETWQGQSDTVPVRKIILRYSHVVGDHLRAIAMCTK